MAVNPPDYRGLLRPSNLENALPVGGLDLIFGARRDVPREDQEHARAYWNEFIQGAEGETFLKYWDALDNNHHLKRDGRDGIFKIFHFMADKMKYNYRSLERNALNAFRSGNYGNPVADLTQQIFEIPNELNAFLLEPLFPNEEWGTLRQKPLKDLSSSWRASLHIFLNMMGAALNESPRAH